MQTNTLSAQELDLLREKVHAEVAERPPTIGVIGVSGVGKSSTINTLLGATLPTSDTVACTKEFWSIDAELTFSSGHAAGLATHLRIVDAPGLAEDMRRDEEYLKAYRRHLPVCDVVLWVMAARNRAVALDQFYLAELADVHPRMVFGINQVDLVEPLDWHPVLNEPSERQHAAIEEISADRRARLAEVVEDDVVVVPYSAKAHYNLQALFAALLAACPGDRAWLFAGLKSFTYDAFLTGDARELLDKAGVSIDQVIAKVAQRPERGEDR
jgi:hypothetical protein